MAKPRFQVICAPRSAARHKRRYLWRFMSSNNRNIAMSLDLFENVEDCLVAIKAMQQTCLRVKLRLQELDGKDKRLIYRVDGRDIAVSAPVTRRLDQMLTTARAQCFVMWNCTETVTVQDGHRGRCQ